MSITVDYKGVKIAESAGNALTLLTAGKYLEADVLLSASGGGGSPYIAEMYETDITPTENMPTVSVDWNMAAAPNVVLITTNAVATVARALYGAVYQRLYSENASGSQKYTNASLATVAVNMTAPTRFDENGITFDGYTYGGTKVYLVRGVKYHVIALRLNLSGH